MTIQDIINSIIAEIELYKSQHSVDAGLICHIEIIKRIFSLYYPDESSVLNSFIIDKDKDNLWLFAHFMSCVEHFNYNLGYMNDKVCEFEKTVNNARENLKFVCSHVNRLIAHDIEYELRSQFVIQYDNLFRFSYDKNDKNWKCRIIYDGISRLPHLRPNSSEFQITKEGNSKYAKTIRVGNDSVENEIESILDLGFF